MKHSDLVSDLEPGDLFTRTRDTPSKDKDTFLCLEKPVLVDDILQVKCFNLNRGEIQKILFLSKKSSWTIQMI